MTIAAAHATTRLEQCIVARSGSQGGQQAVPGSKKRGRGEMTTTYGLYFLQLICLLSFPRSFGFLLPHRQSVKPLSGHAASTSDQNAEWYVRHWDHLLQEEHRAAVVDLRERRSKWSKRQLEATGVSLVGVSAEPDSELYGEKIIRVYREGKGNTRLRDLYTRGDVLMMTPEDVGGPRRFGGASFRGRKIIRQKTSTVVPREVCVMDVGSDWLTASVGPSWPAGMWESRKHAGFFQVRLDKTVPKATLLAQKKSLDLLRRGKAGIAATALVDTFFLNSTSVEEVASRVPSRLQSAGLEASISKAIQEAKEVAASFQPNSSQEQAIAWALKRRLSLIRGPPGTGKTLCAALLISAAIRLKGTDNTIQPPRVLAVAHSNGAADVLLQALLQMGVPAVRVGRPATVGAEQRHRTIVAMAERHPDVKELRTRAMNLKLESHVRSTAAQEVVRCLNEVRRMIATTASVVVASCIGAHQLLEEGNSFTTVVLDEAAQTTEPALVCALATAQADQIVFVGDTRQLPPTVASDTKELRDSLGVSPMARLESLLVAQRTLKVQYRMPPDLLQFPSQYFYNGLVTCADEITTTALRPPAGFPWPKSQPIAFVSVGPNLESTHDMGGKSNPTEAEVVVNVVMDIVKAQDVKASNIAIISPYSKQVQLLRTLLASRNIRDIRIGTVDSFQGQETDLVIFSAVRSNPMSDLGFLRDPRRLCVALTRARRGLIVVGDSKALQSSRHWEALLGFCRERGCILERHDLESETIPEATTPEATNERLMQDTSDAALVAALEASLTDGEDGLEDLFDP